MVIKSVQDADAGSLVSPPLGNKNVIFSFYKKHTGHRMQKILLDHSGAVNVLLQGMTLAVKV